MSLKCYDYLCERGHTFEKFVEGVVEEIVCTTCNAPARITWHTFPGTKFGANAQRFPAVTVFRNPATGEYSIPGQSTDPTPSGCVREELTTLSAVRRFERDYNSNRKREVNASLENQSAYVNDWKSRKRSELLQKSQHFSPAGRDFQRLAAQKSNERPTLSQKAARYESNFRFLAFSDNESKHRDIARSKPKPVPANVTPKGFNATK